MEPELLSFRDAATRPSPRSVVILDDHEDHVLSLSLLFCAWGFAVRSAQAGAAALEAMRQAPPDVFIVDIGKLYLGGLTVVRQMRMSENLKRILVISLSGFARRNISPYALDAGCDYFFSKPADPLKLQELIRSLSRPGR